MGSLVARTDTRERPVPMRNPTPELPQDRPTRSWARRLLHHSDGIGLTAQVLAALAAIVSAIAAVVAVTQ